MSLFIPPVETPEKSGCGFRPNLVKDYLGPELLRELFKIISGILNT